MMNKLTQSFPYLYILPAIFLLSLPFSHTVSIRLITLFVFMLITAKQFFSEKKYKPHCIEILVVWFFLSLFSLYSAVDFNYSLREIKTEIIYGLICFLSFYVFSKNKERMSVLVYVISFSIVAACCWAIFSYFSYGKWINNAIFGGVGGLSTMVVTTLPIIIFSGYLVFKKQGNFRFKFLVTAFSIIALLSILYAGYLTKNVALWPALAIQLMMMVFLLPIRFKKIIFITFVPVLVVSLIYGMYVVGSQKGRMPDFSIDSVNRMLNRDSRPPVWGNVIEKISENPLQGKGFGRGTLGKAYPDISDNPVFWHSHNIFLDAGVQMGVPGILALIGIFTCLGWFFYRLRRFGDTELLIISAIGIAIIAGVIMKNMSDSFFNRHWALLFWAQMGILMGYASMRMRDFAHKID